MKLSKIVLYELDKIDQGIEDRINCYENLKDRTLKQCNEFNDPNDISPVTILLMLTIQQTTCGLIHDILLITIAPNIKPYSKEIISYVESLMTLNKKLSEKMILSVKDINEFTSEWYK